MTSSKDRIVVGVDFGTTFSGVAFMYSANTALPDNVDIVKSWPGSGNVTSDKVPTEIAYDSFDGPPKWGYLFKPEDTRLRCIKLLLDQRQTLPSWVTSDSLFDQLQKSGKTPIRAVADYLTELSRIASMELTRRFGQQMMLTTKIEYVLTVPAVWSDAAKDATLKAAELAGLGRDLRLIAEPEAAAVYTLKAMSPGSLAVGDVYIVCDAGGGTVDLISYEVEQATPLRLREVVPGTGFLCGAAFLNLRFEDLVAYRLGAEEFERIRTRKPKTWAVALKYFEEYVKRTFNPSDNPEHYDIAEFNVPFPGVADSEAARVDCGFFSLSTAEVAEIFRPVVDQVLSLVERQRLEALNVGKTAKGVVLVGGFGQSSYLFNVLKFRFAGTHAPPPYHNTPPACTKNPTEQDPTLNNGCSTPSLIIIQPMNAWTAVVRGAVLRGVEGVELVTSRKSRRHYGLAIAQVPFDGLVHSFSNKSWDNDRETYIADNQIEWVINKGHDLSSVEPVLMRLTEIRRIKEDKCVTALWCSDTDVAPKERRGDAASDAYHLCDLKFDLSKIPTNFWTEHKTSRGRLYHELDFHIGMQVESGRICFDLRVDGVIYSTVMADFE